MELRFHSNHIVENIQKFHFPSIHCAKYKVWVTPIDTERHRYDKILITLRYVDGYDWLIFISFLGV